MPSPCATLIEAFDAASIARTAAKSPRMAALASVGAAFSPVMGLELAGTLVFDPTSCAVAEAVMSDSIPSVAASDDVNGLVMIPIP